MADFSRRGFIGWLLSAPLATIAASAIGLRRGGDGHFQHSFDLTQIKTRISVGPGPYISVDSVDNLTIARDIKPDIPDCATFTVRDRRFVLGEPLTLTYQNQTIFSGVVQMIRGDCVRCIDHTRSAL